MTYKSDKRLYLNADRTRVVEEGHPDSAYLLVGEGGEISDQEAKQYGLKDKPAKAAAETDDGADADAKDSEPKAASAKAISAPPENKARTIKVGKDE